MRHWLTVVEQDLEGNYLVLRHMSDRPDEWYVAVVTYPQTFQPAPSSISVPADPRAWIGPFASRQAARAAADRLIADGCVFAVPM